MPGRHHIKGRNSLTVRDIYASEGKEDVYEKLTAHPERRRFRDKFNMRQIGAVVLTVASALVLNGNHTTADASTNIYVPGTGGGGTPIEQADHQVRINYSAKTPIIDDMPGSIEEGVTKTIAAIEAADDSEEIKLEGYSQGAIVAEDAADEYAAENPDKELTLITKGNPCQPEINGRGGIQTMNPWLSVLTGDTCGNEDVEDNIEETIWVNAHEGIGDAPDFAALIQESPEKAPIVIAEELAGYAVRHSDYNRIPDPDMVDTYILSNNTTVHYVNYENSAIVDAAEKAVGPLPEPLKDVINDVVDDAFGESESTGGNVETPTPMPSPMNLGSGTPIFDMLNAKFGNPFLS